MSRNQLIALRAVLVLPMLLAIAVVAQAQMPFDRQAERKPKITVRRTPKFNVSGVYSGVSAGEVSIDGVMYRIAPSARIYQLGQGIVSLQSLPLGTRSYATGSGAAETGAIFSLVARPVSESYRAQDDEVSSIRLRDPSAAR